MSDECTPVSVLSFDVGMRNLAAAIVALRPGFAFPAEYCSYANDTETPDAFRLRCFGYFVRHGWQLSAWEVMDITDVLDGGDSVKRVKSLNMARQAIALQGTLQALHTRWFVPAPEGTAPAQWGLPTSIAIECQHNGNAPMRAVGMGISMFWLHALPALPQDIVSGARKLAVCDALGIPVGAGVAVKTAAKAARASAAAAKAAAKAARVAARERARAARTGTTMFSVGVPAVVQPAPADGGVAASLTAKKKFAGREKYLDNKARAILAATLLLPAHVAAKAKEIGKLDDLADAFLQGVWVLWSRFAKPRAPARRRRAAPTATAAAAPKPAADEDVMDLTCNDSDG